VGPESAGADPGPVCYGNGGTTPTTTDADLVLGYLDPENFAGGKIRLDITAAQSSMQALADQLDMSLYELASGVATIAEFQMADLIRKVTVQKGLDPREFVVFAFGGAGPVHMGVAARELGVSKVIVPQGDTAAVWCAFGAASADVLHVSEQAKIMSSPFDKELVNKILLALKEKGMRQLNSDGINANEHKFQYSLDMRHRGQINEVEVFLDTDSLDENSLALLREKFVSRYEQLYGLGAALYDARLEIVTARCRASAISLKPKLNTSELDQRSVSPDAQTGVRKIYWAEDKKIRPTSIFDGYKMCPGNYLEGPCVIETETTSIVVHPGQSIEMDSFKNFVINP
jgi:N-methylhydantoinase A